MHLGAHAAVFNRYQRACPRHFGDCELLLSATRLSPRRWIASLVAKIPAENKRMGRAAGVPAMAALSAASSPGTVPEDP